jgi:(p)ppGpp synthase/HD superfamily hydrolase
MDVIEWIRLQHRSTNHLYGELPYEFHLSKVAGVAHRFRNLVNMPNRILNLAAWGHDLIEDTRNTYNDVKNMLGVEAADIIYAVTNEKGKTRSERANDKYYEEMRKVDGAVFIKLCDRIANIEHSLSKDSLMIDVYIEENESFLRRLKVREDHPELQPMVDYLLQILAEK